MVKRSYEELENSHTETVLKSMDHVRRNISKYFILIVFFLIFSVYLGLEIIWNIKLLLIIFLTIVLVFYLMRNNPRLDLTRSAKLFILFSFFIIFYIYFSTIFDIYLNLGYRFNLYTIYFFCFIVIFLALNKGKKISLETIYPYICEKIFIEQVPENKFLFSKTNGDYVIGNLKEKRILELSNGTHSIEEVGKILMTEFNSYFSEEGSIASSYEILSKYEEKGFIRFESLSYQAARRNNQIKMYGGILKSIYFMIAGISFLIIGIFEAVSFVILISLMILIIGLALFTVRINRYRKLRAFEKSKNGRNKNDEIVIEPSIEKRSIPKEIRKPNWLKLEEKTEIPLFDNIYCRDYLSRK